MKPFLHKHASSIALVLGALIVAAVFFRDYRAPRPDPWETVCNPSAHKDPLYCYR